MKSNNTPNWEIGHWGHKYVSVKRFIIGSIDIVTLKFFRYIGNIAGSLSNFMAMTQLDLDILWLWDFVRSFDKMFYRLVNGRPQMVGVISFLRSVTFRISQHRQNTGFHLNITFTFDRCHRISAVTLVKYECGPKNLTDIFARSEILLTEKLTNPRLMHILVLIYL